MWVWVLHFITDRVGRAITTIIIVIKAIAIVTITTKSTVITTDTTTADITIGGIRDSRGMGKRAAI
jgi:hypothetical protein